jgi:uroporphyrin-III C-methyltransferase/precorrin-2 dehydrogenase/sirohydrochlorin ferrochelatase
MRYLPLHFNLQGRDVLVIGGGDIAERKITLLLSAGARITVVAPVINDFIASNIGASLEHVLDVYNTDCLKKKILVVAATNNQQVNEQVSADAQALGIPVNVVDSPALCTVTFPAIIDRDPLIISVGSAGGAPVLTRTIRELIERVVPERISILAKYLRSQRDQLKQHISDIDQRRKVTEAFLESPGAELAMSGDTEMANQYLFNNDKSLSQGEVYLVGAGPGDPDLLTLRALQLMQKADIVLYDNLVSPKVLDRVRRDAKREFVGKRSGYKSTSQEDINDLLVRLAKEGLRVLRLKGGDPFIFGRGGEEIVELVRQQIPFQVVPGITAASGCAAYAGIPLTHRDMSRSVRFVTGHPKNGKVDLAWQEYTHDDETIVFYMGLGGLATICQQLVAHGRSSETPIAIVSKGTTPEQVVLKGNLETMPGLAARAQLQSPTLIIVGSVVNFAN